MAEKRWVAAWGAATDVIAQCHGDYFKDQTFRYSFFPTVDGDAIRVHFSNRFGNEPATLTKATVAASLGGHKIDTATLLPLTFDGKASLVMEPGQDYISDRIPLAVKAGQDFTISLYFAELTELTTGHSNNGHFIKKFYGKTDLTEAAELPLELWGENGPYVFVNTIDVETSDEDCRAIVAFGDSITAQPWPDWLAHRMYDLGIRNRTVIRRGIGGNRVLRDYRWRMKKHWGPAGIKRFEREVAGTDGADRVFVLHGINDMIHPGGFYCPLSELPTADELIAGLKQYVDIAHKHGMKIYLATILPCLRLSTAPDGERETMRQTVNAWIRNESGADGVIEFELAVKDPENPLMMLPEYDSGDHLHPSLAGAKQMAYSIPESYFKD